MPATICHNKSGDGVREVILQNLDQAMKYQQRADDLSWQRFGQFRVYDHFLRNMHGVCGLDWETKLAESSFYEEEYLPYYHFHMRYMLALFSMASTEGTLRHALNLDQDKGPILF